MIGKSGNGGFAMITKKTIDQMLALPDDKMAAMLKLVLSTAGADTSGLRFDERTVRRLRAVLGELTDGDLARISTLAERWRTGG
jgi:hypothetical protein